MRTLIIGAKGEVGKALSSILKRKYETYEKDIEEADIPEGLEIMHVCLRYSPDFLETVRHYIGLYKPRIINICTTVPPGTTSRIGKNAVHSTTRGLHPNLELGLRTFVKHIGGPYSELVADYFGKAGIRCVSHRRAETTELAHILDLYIYGVNVMAAQEAADLCRKYGVDYLQTVLAYGVTRNEGFSALDHESKCRMLLTPPNGPIGGHCVSQAAGLIPPEERPLLMSLLADYNNENRL